VQKTYYVTHYEDSIRYAGHERPPLLFYGHFNFILLDNPTKIYFFKQELFRHCGNGLDFTKPPNIFLTPDSLKEIKIAELHTFLGLTISDTDSIILSDKFISIASPVDTIKNEGIKIILDYLKSKKMGRYNIRNWTEEEKFAVLAKVNNKKYNRDSLHFKVGFNLKFNPPKKNSF
jgi:hypothetical protein